MPVTVAVDFDGVIHRYSKKWHDGSIYDEPIPGSKEALQYLLDRGCEVVIYSTRCFDRNIKNKQEKHQVEEMRAWLNKYKIPYTRIHTEPNKPLCVLFIDDNAYRFTGNWGVAIKEVSQLLETYGVEAMKI